MSISQKEPRKSEMTYSELCTEVKQDSEGYFSPAIRYKIGFETHEWLLQAQCRDNEEAKMFAERIRKRGSNTVIIPKQNWFLVYVDHGPTHGKTSEQLVEGVEIK